MTIAKRLVDAKLIWLLPLVGLGYIMLGKVSVEFSTMPEGIAIAWLPNGLLLALFLTRPRKEWLWIALTIVPAEIIADFPTFTLAQTLQFAGINLLETFLSASLLRYFLRDEQGFNDTRFVLLFVVISLSFIPSLSAILGALVYHTQINPHVEFIAFWRIWFFGDSIGTLLVTPLITLLVLVPFEATVRKYFWAEMFASNFFILFLTFAIFSQPFNPSILPATPMIFILLSLWIVYRQGLHFGTMLGLLICAISIYFTVAHTGPFSVFDAVQNTLYLQEFIVILVTTILFFGVLLHQINNKSQELLRANEAMTHLTEELEQRVEEKTKALQTANIKLQELAMKDALTGLYNRYSLQEFLNHEITKSLRHNYALSIIEFDIDFFKRINDTYGHQAGDAVLVHVAGSVLKRLRDQDFFARIGGEEFLIVLPSTDKKSAYALAHEIKQRVASLVIKIHDYSITCTISSGVATLSETLNSFELLFADADAKLYKAKAQGRNCVV